MSNTSKIIIVAAIGGTIYFLFFYTIPFTASEVFFQSKGVLSEKYDGEVEFTNEGMYGEYMLHIKMKPKGEKEIDYYCGYTATNILCSNAVQGLNEMVEESHSDLKRIKRD